MTEFFKTVMGRKFYESDVPRVANALERIARALEQIAESTVTPTLAEARTAYELEQLDRARSK